MSRIDLNIVATGQFAQVESALARLRAQIASLNAQSLAIGGVSSDAIRSVQSYADSFNVAIDRSGMFERHMVNMTTETERFGRSLQQGRLRLSDYSRAMREYRRNEMGQIKQLAREQVRMMNATTMMMPDGKAQVIVPRGINEAVDKQKILNQEYRIFRQVVQGASTQLINWGKNTQWAGRQLTVGLTVPLTIFGATAGKMFMDVDKELTRLGKVYGGTAGKIASPTQVAAIREQTQALAQELAASMGIAAQETAGLAADIAATGAEGADLISATRESVRLSVLGEVDRQEAMRATLAIQSVFKKSNEELADSINFLNSVENQTSTTLNDLVTGIVKAGPVVEGLGGSIEDLAMMMVAMREGGVPAAEAANAIKSSMGSLINPTKVTSEQFKEMGINLKGLVDKNAGDLIGTLSALQEELSALDDLSRQRAIEQLFGKYQFARINALLSNLGRAGSQTEEVVKLTQLSVEQLAKTAENELKVLTESTSMRFKRALESLKANLVPIGETFVKIGTILLEIGNKVFEVFNSLPEPVQNFVKGLGLLVGIAGPIIMITGVMGNFLGYVVKGVAALLAFKRAGRGVFEFFTPESVAAKTASELLTGAVYNQTEAFGVMNAALEALNQNLKEMTSNLSAAGSASGTMAARTMAAAEAASVTRGGTIDPDSIMGSIYYDPSGSKYRGFERSHNIPMLGAEGNLQTSAMILPDYMTSERAFQSASKGWTPEFYDPSSGISRREFLARNAYTPSAKNLITNQKAHFTDEGLARLAPTREEYRQGAASYLAGLKTLVMNTNEETKDAIASARASGDFPRMRQLIQAAIAENGSAYRAYMTEISTSLDASGNTMEQMTRSAMAMESQITPSSGLLRTNAGGRGFNSFLYSLMGGGIAEIESGMKVAAQQIVDPIGMTARQVIAEGKRAGQRLVGVANSKGIKYVVDVSNGIEKAVVYTIDQSTGKITAKLNGAARAAVLRSTATQAALTRHDGAVARLDAATRADIDAATAATLAAAGQATPGVPAPGIGANPRQPGRFSRFMGGAGGMGLMGGMSALSMLGGATQGNSAMSILGATGMGASLGMMAGPKGAAAGAVIGALAGTVMSAKSNMDEVRSNAKKLADSMTVGAESLTAMSEFFGGSLLAERASASAVLEGTGIRKEEFTQAQEYLASESGKAFSDGFSEAISSVGFGRAVDNLAGNLGNMIMQGAISFENAEAISAALAEQLQMPELTAQVVGKLNRIVGPNGEDLKNNPITVAVKLQAQNADALAQTTSAVLNSGIGNIEATPLQTGLTASLGPTGMLLSAMGGMDIPGVSGVVRDLTGFVNSDYSAAVAGVTTLGRTIGNTLRSSYDNLNSAVFRYNQLEEQATNMRKGPEKKKLLAELETEKRKIDDLKIGYDQMRKQAQDSFAKIIATDAGLASESLSAMGESLKETFAGTVEAPAAEALIGMLSGMDQQLQANIMLNISSGQMSPTATMSFLNVLGGGEDAAKALDLVVNAKGLEGANETLLKLMQIEDEEVRKTLILQLVAESGGEDYAIGISDGEKNQLESDLKDLRAKRDQILDNKEDGTVFSFLKPDFYDDDLADVEADIASIESRIAEAERRAAAVRDSAGGGYTMPLDAARYQAQAGGIESVIGPQVETITEYTLAAQELGKLDVAPKIDLSGVEGVTDKALGHVNSLFNQILELPDSIVKSINVNAVQANADMEAFNVNWEDINSKRDLEKSIKAVDDFSGAFGAFGINYKEFSALPDIVKSVILHYVTMYQTLTMAFTSATRIAANSTGEAYGQATKAAAQASLAMDRARAAVADVFGASQDAGYTPPAPSVPSSSGGGGDDSGGGGGKEEDKYKKLIEQQNKLIEGIQKEREERERIARLQEESLNFMLDQQSLQNDIARAKAEGNFAEAALLQARKDIEKEQRDRELAEDARQRAEDKEIAKRQQIIEILEKGGKFADKLAAALNKLDGRIPFGLLRGKGGKKKADGGAIFGPGGPRSDVIPAMLSNGEFVMQADAVDKYGLPFMYMLNNKTLPAFGGGGYSSRYPGMASRMYRGGLARKMYGSNSNENIEYNINVQVAGSNSSADEIAAEVLKAMQRRERMNRSVTRI